MQAAMMVTWTHPIVGREEKALHYAAEVAEFWGKQAEAGRVSPPQMFFSDAGYGTWIVTGERDTILQLHDTDEARLLMMKGELLLEAFRVDICYTGDAAVDFMSRYTSALSTVSAG